MSIRFRTRDVELKDLIKTFKGLTPVNGDLTFAENIHSDLRVIQTFVKQQIEELCDSVIENTLLEDEIPFAFDCAEMLYQFDKLLFEEIFGRAVEKKFQQDSFFEIIALVRKFKFFAQAFIGYKVIYNALSSIADNNQEIRELAKGLNKMRSMEGYNQLSPDIKSEIESLAAQCNSSS